MSLTLKKTLFLLFLLFFYNQLYYQYGVLFRQISSKRSHNSSHLTFKIATFLWNVNFEICFWHKEVSCYLNILQNLSTMTTKKKKLEKDFFHQYWQHLKDAINSWMWVTFYSMKNLENTLSLKKTNKLLLLTGLLSTCKANCASFFFLWFFLSLCYLVSLCYFNKQKSFSDYSHFYLSNMNKKRCLVTSTCFLLPKKSPKELNTFFELKITK